MYEANDDWSPELRAKELARLRRNLYYGPVFERVPVPDDLEIEILDDPRYVRVGSRFGFTLNYAYDDNSHRIVFCDQGPYLPRANRPAGARVPYSQELIDEQGESLGYELIAPTIDELPITDQEYAEWLGGQYDATRYRGVAVMRALQNSVVPERFPLMDMRFWLANQDPTPDPVLTIRCQAARRKRPCRQRIGRMWRTEYGLYGVARYAPSHDVRRVIAMAEDDDYTRRLDAGEEYEFAPEYHDVPEIGIAIACPDHGNGTLDVGVIVEAANNPNRRALNVDVLEGQSRANWH